MRFLVVAMALVASGCGKGDGGTGGGGDTQSTGGTTGVTGDTQPPENSNPSIGITAPEDSQALPSATPLTLQATISDAESASAELAVTWTSSLDGTLAGAAALEGDVSSLSLDDGLSAGTHTLTASISDPDGGRGEDSVLVDVRENEPPSLAFENPEDDDIYPPGTALEVSLRVADDWDAPAAIALSWSGDLGTATPPDAADADGLASFSLGALALGDYSLSVIGLDTAGSSSATTVVFTIAEPKTGDTGDTGP